MHVHAIGDRAVREALDAFAGPATRTATCATTSRTCSWSDPTDVARFAELGVAANMQALWACLDDQMIELTLPFLGAERGRWQYPFGDLPRAGARAGMGSDWPVAHARPARRDPRRGHPHGLRRRRAADGSEPFLPEQALDLPRRVRGVHRGQRVGEPPRRRGRARDGAVADLVVLDRDPFAGPSEEIGAARRGLARGSTDARSFEASS